MESGMKFNFYLLFLSTTMTTIATINSTTKTPTTTPAITAELLLPDGVAETTHT